MKFFEDVELKFGEYFWRLNKSVSNNPNHSHDSVLVCGVYLNRKDTNVVNIVKELGSSCLYKVDQYWASIGGIYNYNKSLLEVTKHLTGAKIPKFKLLNILLSEVKLANYKYIIFVDDDIRLTPGFVDKYLYLQDKYRFLISQPARNISSELSHTITRRSLITNARQTNFVEIGPLFSFHRNIYKYMLPFDELSPMGWGYDFIWPAIAIKYGFKMGIIDAVSIDHSIRPTRANYSTTDVKKQMEAILLANDHLKREQAFKVLKYYYRW